MRCVQHAHGYLSLFSLSELLLLRVLFNSCSVACLVDFRFGSTDQVPTNLKINASIMKKMRNIS